MSLSIGDAYMSAVAPASLRDVSAAVEQRPTAAITVEHGTSAVSCRRPRGGADLDVAAQSTERLDRYDGPLDQACGSWIGNGGASPIPRPPLRALVNPVLYDSFSERAP
jgi:hypothetical protein